MARYIDADKLVLDGIANKQIEVRTRDVIENDTKVISLIFHDLQKVIDDAPTEDVRPVVRGKWQRITQGRIGEIYRCSKCGRTIEEQGSESLIPIRYPYCHCGADMREVEE
jgi:DNA-directed RNA polymerase subunit RPC12/RpoP